MKHLSVLIKPASSLCNLRCKYCFYANVSSIREVRSYGRMSTETMQKMIEHIFVDLEDGDHLTLAFQGGEPTLAGLRYFQQLTALVQAQTKQVTLHYALQTNGILLNDQWCQFLKQNHFLVGLSIDGSSNHHDLNRVDTKGQGTFQRVLAAKKRLDTYGVDYNILCVLTNQLANEAEAVFQFIKENQIRYLQLIPCLDDLDAKVRGNYGLTPKGFAAFYQQLLEFWLQELKQGNYISIKLFDDLIQLLVNQQLTACGILGSCQVQYVIEADGSVYPCDFYVLDEYRMGYIQEQTLRQLFEQDVSWQFFCEKRKLSATCQTCPFLKMCHAGCKRMKDAVYVDEEGFCGYQQLLQVFLPKLDEMIQAIQQIKEGQQV